jgi:soluble lytic murein transglycosylase-like protein
MALAASPEERHERIRASMQSSIEKQKASIRVQAEKANLAPPSLSAPQPDFFALPFPQLSVPPPAAASGDCDPLPDAELDELVSSSAKAHSLQPDLVRAVLRKESGGRPCAVSPKGAQGLMQIMPATAETLNLADPFDPKQNVDAGARYLKQMLERFNGDLPLALAAYNAGPGAVDKERAVPDITETKDYVSAILKMLGIPAQPQEQKTETAAPSAGTTTQ